MASQYRRSPRLLLTLAVVCTAVTGCSVDIPSPLTGAAAAGHHTTPGASPLASLGMVVGSDPLAFWDPAVMPGGAPMITAKAGILVDVDTGEILWQRDPHLALAPASTTKVLTALVALENLNPELEVTITPGALGQSAADTRMGLKAGETLSVTELLEGMLLPSGDDAASAIAADTVGTAKFVATMNAQVAALGLSDSHFTNTSGLDAPGLRASAYDLAAIAAFTYDDFPLFDQIVATPSVQLPATIDHPAFHLRNLDALLSDYPAAVGIKPGWTGDAGACLIGMAIRNGHRLVAVLLNAAYPARLEARLLDWGFSVEGMRPLLPPTPTPHPTAAASSTRS